MGNSQHGFIAISDEMIASMDEWTAVDIDCINFHKTLTWSLVAPLCPAWDVRVDR